MTITEPFVQPLNNRDNVEHVAECASVCYNSTPSNAQRLYDRLIASGHISMLRHESHYYIIPEIELDEDAKSIFRHSPFCASKEIGDKFYISTNGQFERELEDKHHIYIDYFEVNVSEFFKPDIFELIRLTYVCNTQIAISRELNRVSPNNIAERSTRYIDFLRKLGLRFSKPHWWNTRNLYQRALAWLMMKSSATCYRIARSRFGLNLRAEDARYYLPLGTETQVVYTYTITEWEHILDLRFHGTTGKPHPDAKALVAPIYSYIKVFREEFTDNTCKSHDD